MGLRVCTKYDEYLHKIVHERRQLVEIFTRIYALLLAKKSSNEVKTEKKSIQNVLYNIDFPITLILEIYD